MTRAEQPTAQTSAPDDALVADSRERAVRALLRRPQLKRLWSAQLVGSVGDALALLVLVVLALQAAISEGSFAGGYRGVAFAVATVFGTRILATLLFGVGSFDPVFAVWYLRNRNSPGMAELWPFAFGETGWRPVTGDWDGAGAAPL